MPGLGSKGFSRAGLITLLVVAGLALLAPSLLAQQAAPAGPRSTPESGYMRVLLRPTHPPVFDAQQRPTHTKKWPHFWGHDPKEARGRKSGIVVEGAAFAEKAAWVEDSAIPKEED